MNIKFKLNNKTVSIKTDPMRRLIDVLRDDFSLTGVKEGCGEGECGACSVLIDKQIVNSCITPILAVEDKDVFTIEGLKNFAQFKILNKAFIDAGAVQCGFCTPGFIIASLALLMQNKNPDEEEIRKALSGNLCRCTGHNMIVEAVKTASKKGKNIWK